MSHKDETICIEIAAFKESELLNTVHSALLQADYPERIHFAICYQYDLMDDYYELLKIPNCRIKYFKESETKGLCFARNHCQHLIEDEPYVLQIDAHMRFVKHWDTEMIEQLVNTHDDHAIISFYPSNCKEDMMKLPLNDPVFDEPCPSCVLCAADFKPFPSYFITFHSFPQHEPKEMYRRNPFISGNNFFSYSRVHKEVYNDPYMFFYADEIAMALRLFTFGWNVYIPQKSYIYHQYERKNQSFPKITTQMIDEDRRFNRLIEVGEENIDLGEYGLGSKRTLAQYEAFSGIDFKNRLLTIETRNGEFDVSSYEHLKKTSPKKVRKEVQLLREREHITVYIADLFGDYMDCIKSCLSNSGRPDLVHFVVGTTGLILDPSLYETYHILDIMSFKQNTSFSKIMAKITKKLEKGTACYVDSHVRFLMHWDRFYLSQMFDYGEQGVLTSWVWKPDEDKDLSTIHPYTNVVYTFDREENGIPVLLYDSSIKLDNRPHPYQTAFIFNFFLFGFADTLKKVPIDPDLSIEEQRLAYSLRLWTNGIDLLLPRSAQQYRLTEESVLETNPKHPSVIAGLFGMADNYDSKHYPWDYPYGLGTARSLASFHELIHFKSEK